MIHDSQWIKKLSIRTPKFNIKIHLFLTSNLILDSYIHFKVIKSGSYCKKIFSRQGFY